MMDLYSPLIQKKTYWTVLLVDRGLGMCAHVLVCVRERKSERERQREILFCLSLSVNAYTPPPLSSRCHGNSHQIRTSAIAFISCCPLAAYRLSVYINSVMETSQSPAAACHFNKRSHPAQFRDHLHSRGGERRADFF